MSLIDVVFPQAPHENDAHPASAWVNHFSNVGRLLLVKGMPLAVTAFGRRGLKHCPIFRVVLARSRKTPSEL